MSRPIYEEVVFSHCVYTGHHSPKTCMSKLALGPCIDERLYVNSINNTNEVLVYAVGVVNY